MVDQNKIDADHLKLLAIFHYIVAGIELLGIGFIFIHYYKFSMMFNNPEIWEHQQGPPPPAGVFDFFIVFYFIAGFFILLAATLNFLSARFITQRKNRIFSLITAGINCLQFPFGTTLGVFTFIVLLRDSVSETYEHKKAA